MIQLMCFLFLTKIVGIENTQPIRKNHIQPQTLGDPINV